MWRINNILMSIVLSGIILASGYMLIQAISWEIESHNNETDQIKRTINAGDTLNEHGQKLRLHSVSYNAVISHKTWGPWSIVPIQHATLGEPVPLDEGQLGYLNSSAPMLKNQFANNVVLRNQGSHNESILFDKKVAIASYLALHNQEIPSLAIAYADEDTNGDGKISPSDELKVRYFRFGKGKGINLSFDGTLHSYSRSQNDQSTFHLTVFIDSNKNSTLEENFETAALYEVNIETGVVSKALNENTVTQLQSILDGVNTSKPSN